MQIEKMKKSELNSKVAELLHNGIVPTSTRLENIALVFMGRDMVVREPWDRNCVATPK